MGWWVRNNRSLRKRNGSWFIDVAAGEKKASTTISESMHSKIGKVMKYLTTAPDPEEGQLYCHMKTYMQRIS